MSAAPLPCLTETGGFDPQFSLVLYLITATIAIKRTVPPSPSPVQGGWCNPPPWGFSRIAAGFWATLWGKPSAIFGKKNLTGSGQVTVL